jgi:hypothetical protein
MAAFVLAGVCLYAGVTNNSIIATITGKAEKGKGDIAAPGAGGAPGTGASPSVGGATSGTRDAVVQAAHWGVNNISSGYSATRPMPSSLQACKDSGSDCSGFATLCYKAANAPDPNGLGYNGEGYTGTMMTHGHHVTQANPADLHFWTGPAHVAVDIGGGQIAEWGGGPSPIVLALSAEMAFHAGYLGARSYLPLDDNSGEGNDSHSATRAGGTTANAARHFAGVS